MAYTRGNLAVQQKTAERVHGAPKYRETTKVITRKNTLPAREKWLYLLTLAFVVVISGMLIWRNAHLYQIKSQIHQVEKGISKAKAQFSEYSVQKQNLLQAIPSEAAKQGFVAPDQEGITVGSVEQESGMVDIPPTAKK